MENDIKSPELEKGIQGSRHNSIVTADNPNANYGSALVEWTNELTIAKVRDVTLFPTGQKKGSASDKIDRIEKLLTTLKDKMKKVILKAHSRREDQTKAFLKKEDNQTSEPIDTVRVKPERLASGKTMVSV